MPLPAYLAKWAKKRFGMETLLKIGWNLFEAERERLWDGMFLTTNHTNKKKILRRMFTNRTRIQRISLAHA
jgi:hypothetical protein